MAPTWLAPLLLTCAPEVHSVTASALVQTESAFNPWAIGVVGGTLVRQPRSAAEAVATALALRAAGLNFSVGLSQINVRNWERLGLTATTAVDPCRNLAAMQTVLLECQARAGPGVARRGQASLQRTLSCYYSGNFATGFQHGYVQRVRAAVPAVRPVFPVPLKEQP